MLFSKDCSCSDNLPYMCFSNLIFLTARCPPQRTLTSLPELIYLRIVYTHLLAASLPTFYPGIPPATLPCCLHGTLSWKLTSMESQLTCFSLPLGPHLGLLTCTSASLLPGTCSKTQMGLQLNLILLELLLIFVFLFQIWITFHINVVNKLSLTVIIFLESVPLSCSNLTFPKNLILTML